MNTPGYRLFHGQDVPPSSPAQALFHILPVPFEASVSYGTGTALGPRAILEASAQLERFDGKSRPCDKGIYTAPAIDCDDDTETVLARISDAVTQSLKHNALPIVIGGEHTVTLGPVRALKDSGRDFGVIQFDAHADLRNTYENTPYSHACVMRRILEMGIPLIQIGTRSYSREEADLRSEKNICFYDAETIAREGIKAVRIPSAFPRAVYLTIDIDALDSSIMPATGTPVPGGLGWYPMLWIIEALLKERTCIGFDIVEFAPVQNIHAYNFAAAQLIYNIMGRVVDYQSQVTDSRPAVSGF